MSTQGIFDSSAINQSDCSGDGSPSKARKLWWDTWARIDQFLPRFLQDLFPNETPPTISNSVVKAVQPQEDVAAGSTENVASDEGIPPAHYAEESSSGSGMGQLSSESSAVLLGASPGSSPPNSHIPPPTSPVPSDPICEFVYVIDIWPIRKHSFTAPNLMREQGKCTLGYIHTILMVTCTKHYINYVAQSPGQTQTY